MEWSFFNFKKGTSGDCLVQLSCQSTVTYSRLPRTIYSRVFIDGSLHNPSEQSIPVFNPHSQKMFSYAQMEIPQSI